MAWFNANIRSWFVAACALVSTLPVNLPAWAVPSFARQTNLPCSACHVGSFGPQLTAYGRTFKLEGYTAGQYPSYYVPLSAMAIASFTHTKTSQPTPVAEHDGANDNFALDQASVFLAGKITDHVGVFGQLTYSEVDGTTHIDNVDARYARYLTIVGKDAIFGLSLNNNPGVQDAGNTLPAFAYPYVASALSPGTNVSPLLAGGLAQLVGGASAYLYWNNSWYVEAGAYHAFGRGFLKDFGVLPVDTPVPLKLSGWAPYGRLTYTRDLSGKNLTFGVVVLHADVLPNEQPGPSDKYTDLVFTAALIAPRANGDTWTINSTLITEWQSLDGSQAAEASANIRNQLTSFKIDASYYWHETYGLTIQYFNQWGSTDTGLYTPGEIGGSRIGSPDNGGFLLQADWTPLGKDKSWAQPWANLRIGLQYTIYTHFNGSSSNYDGFGRSASDNNSLFLFVWTAF